MINQDFSVSAGVTLSRPTRNESTPPPVRGVNFFGWLFQLAAATLLGGWIFFGVPGVPFPLGESIHVKSFNSKIRANIFGIYVDRSLFEGGKVLERPPRWVL